MALRSPRPQSPWTGEAAGWNEAPRHVVERDSALPTRELGRIARGTRPQVRQDLEDLDVDALDVVDPDGTGALHATHAVPRASVDLDDDSATVAIPPDTGATKALPRSTATAAAVGGRCEASIELEDSFDREIATAQLGAPALAALRSSLASTTPFDRERSPLPATTPFERTAGKAPPLQPRKPPPPPIPPRPAADAESFESEEATRDVRDVPTRANSSRADVPRRAASNGGVMAPVAFDETRALSPRAQVQLARRLASAPMPVAEPPPDLDDSATHAVLGAADVAIVDEGESGLLYLDASSAKADDHEELGPYILHERIGSGGMGEVHRADLRGIAGFRKSIALKRMWPHLAQDAQLVQCFVQEARLASMLRHHNIAQAYDFGKLDGTYYIAMELVEGPTLNAAMKQAHRAAGAIPVAVAIDVLAQLCEALEYAHGLADDSGRPLGIVHRDVSPANIILSESGLVKLIDFGVAKAQRSSVHTQAGVIKGKLAYVAPEYVEGQLDARADLWSVGVIAYELLTGQRLFIGEHDYETLRNVREKPIYAPSRINPQIGRDLDDIVLTALERDPERRWQSAGALRNALSGIAHELRIALGGAAIREWVAWAFAQEPRRDTKIVRVLKTMDTSEQPVAAAAQATVDRLRHAHAQRTADRGTVAPSPSPIAAPAPASAPVGYPISPERARAPNVTMKIAPRRELSVTPFAQSRVLERRDRSGIWWMLLLLATIGGFIALAISQGWLSESTLDDLAHRADRLRTAFE